MFNAQSKTQTGFKQCLAQERSLEILQLLHTSKTQSEHLRCSFRRRFSAICRSSEKVKAIGHTKVPAIIVLSKIVPWKRKIRLDSYLHLFRATARSSKTKFNSNATNRNTGTGGITSQKRAHPNAENLTQRGSRALSSVSLREASSSIIALKIPMR